MKIGAVNCRTIAFAEVVSLLAPTKQRNVAARKNMLFAMFLLKNIFCFVISAKTSAVIAAKDFGTLL